MNINQTKNKNMKKSLLTLAAVVGMASAAQAQLLFSDGFDYPNGSLTTESGGLWVNHSGTGSAIQVTTGSIALVQGSGSREDVNRSAGEIMGAGDIWFSSINVAVTGGSTDVYFAHFKDDSTDFGARIFVTSFGGSDFTFGLSDGSSSPDVVWATGLNFGDIYTVVTSYNFDTGETRLWVNPIDESSLSISVVGAVSADFSAYGFRQASGDSVQTIYDVAVGTTFDSVMTAVPEPHEYALAMAGLLLAVVVMRRRARRA